MKRIDKIHSTLKELDEGFGVTTMQISEKLNIERSNVSKDLNKLVKDNKIFKNNSRPVHYFICNPHTTTNKYMSEIDELVYLYPSLIPAVNLAKTAIIYPPNGMNSLIIGNTGVGKSMLAKLMHEYAEDFRNESVPFIHFNCSDYSNNPQLLVSHLFGVKKGTFTGASSDKPGLFEEANNGIIFLDEIHNLPSEGQEMLFLFMDTGYFRRLGEVSKKIKSSARIICATNKDINSSLLDTFIRRIPIKMVIPDLKERLVEERLTLIENFIKEESIKLNQDIFISKKALVALLAYDCPHNVGQLKSDITLIIANSYSKFIIHKKKHLKINSPDLPLEIQSILSKDLTKEIKLVQLMNFNDEEYLCYNSETTIFSHSYLKQKQHVLEKFIELTINISKATKTNLEEVLVKNFNNYFEVLLSYFPEYSYSLNENAYNNFFSMVTLINYKLKDFFYSDKFGKLFRMHMDMLYERVDLIDLDVDPFINKIKKHSPEFYNTALKVKNSIEDIYNINLSDIEFFFILTFLIYIEIK